MNSILQCLNACSPLTRYFLDGSFMKHLSRQNPLGLGGKLADSYAKFLKSLWSGEYSVINPSDFRESLIKFSPQFKGTEQHDSQELLSFLLDGLHEDLNIVAASKNKVVDVENLEASDSELAEQSWRSYLSKNFSVIVSLFQGQLRSKLTCLSCNFV